MSSDMVVTYLTGINAPHRPHLCSRVRCKRYSARGAASSLRLSVGSRPCGYKHILAGTQSPLASAHRSETIPEAVGAREGPRRMRRIVNVVRGPPLAVPGDSGRQQHRSPPPRIPFRSLSTPAARVADVQNTYRGTSTEQRCIPAIILTRILQPDRQHTATVASRDLDRTCQTSHLLTHGAWTEPRPPPRCWRHAPPAGRRGCRRMVPLAVVWKAAC